MLFTFFPNWGCKFDKSSVTNDSSLLCLLSELYFHLFVKTLKFLFKCANNLWPFGLESGREQTVFNAKHVRMEIDFLDLQRNKPKRTCYRHVLLINSMVPRKSRAVCDRRHTREPEQSLNILQNSLKDTRISF